MEAKFLFLSIVLLILLLQQQQQFVDSQRQQQSQLQQYPSRTHWADEHILWECYFEYDSCHFRNQHNLAHFNRYVNPNIPMYGRNTMLILNLRSPQVQRYPGARLISHYYPSGRGQACLFISYHTTGSGPDSFYVIQQDKENTCIYSDTDLQTKSRSYQNQWEDIEIQLDLTRGDPRFFLEVHYNRGGSGTFAIGRFAYGIGECRRPIVFRGC